MSKPELANHLDRIMRKIDAEMHRRVPAVDVHKVGPLGSMMLQRLQNLSPVPIHTLVDAMGRDPSQMSRMIGRLETRGLVRKYASADDGRVTVLELTPSGQEAAHAIQSVSQEVTAAIFADLTDQEANDLLHLLKRANAHR